VTAGKVRNVGASVLSDMGTLKGSHALPRWCAAGEAGGLPTRLGCLDLARRSGDEFNFILTRYGLERLLFRLASSHRDQFVLKGAMLFPLWSGSPHRATHDMDLLAFGPPNPRRDREYIPGRCSRSGG